jgi:hypothetical protein
MHARVSRRAIRRVVLLIAGPLSWLLLADQHTHRSRPEPLRDAILVAIALVLTFGSVQTAIIGARAWRARRRRDRARTLSLPLAAGRSASSEAMVAAQGVTEPLVRRPVPRLAGLDGRGGTLRVTRWSGSPSHAPPTTRAAAPRRREHDAFGVWSVHQLISNYCNGRNIGAAESMEARGHKQIYWGHQIDLSRVPGPTVPVLPRRVLCVRRCVQWRCPWSSG